MIAPQAAEDPREFSMVFLALSQEEVLQMQDYLCCPPAAGEMAFMDLEQAFDCVPQNTFGVESKCMICSAAEFI